jgi:hypothetical protein
VTWTHLSWKENNRKGISNGCNPHDDDDDDDVDNDDKEEVRGGGGEEEDSPGITM